MIGKIKAAALSGCFGLSGLFFLSGCATVPRGEKPKSQTFAELAEEMDEKWGVARKRQELADADPARAPIAQQFLRQLEFYRHQPLMQKIMGLHEVTAKRIAYTSDAELYGVEEYWASPYEALQRNAGDCEDMAVLKYHALRYLGVPAEQLWLALTDTNNDGILDHCVLLVKVSDTQTVVMNNEMFPGTYDQDSIRAHFLFNETGKKVYAQVEGKWTFRDFNPVIDARNSQVQRYTFN